MLENHNSMSSLLSVGRRLAVCSLAGSVVFWAEAQLAFPPQEGEYSLTRGLLGDQTAPALALGAAGGYVVWQDNATDGDGLGVSARAINSSFSPVVARSFRVNVNGTGNQEHPKAVLLADGGAIFVWQGGALGQQDIYARVLSADGTFLTDDLLVNSYTQGQQERPTATLLKNGNVLVVWSSYDQDGSMQGIYGQQLSARGELVGTEFRVNQYTPYNQRSTALATLDNGDVMVTWVSEQQRFELSADVYARRYDGNLNAKAGEFLVNSTTNLCANPAISAAADGGFVVAWSQRRLSDIGAAWDVVARAYDSAGAKLGTEVRLNTYTLGPQYMPRLARLEGLVMAVWTSDYQDGSREGVYGRFVKATGEAAGAEFRVNTTTVSRQIHPVIASDGGDRFLVTWSTFVGGAASFELFAQRYAAVRDIPVPAAPYVAALDSATLQVTWPELAGYLGTVTYRLKVDEAATVVTTTNAAYTLSSLAPGSTHSFRLAYELSSGITSPWSDIIQARTWGEDRKSRKRLSPDGIPDEWQAAYWSENNQNWPALDDDSDGDGALNADEFLAGTNPLDSQSVLRTAITPNSVGLLVAWTSQPGFLYQLQVSTNLATWSEAAPAQFAPGTTTSLSIVKSQTAAYYRVIRVR